MTAELLDLFGIEPMTAQEIREEFERICKTWRPPSQEQCLELIYALLDRMEKCEEEAE